MKSAPNHKLITRLQRSLGDIVVVLSEIRTKRSLTRTEREEIDNAVRELKETIIILPQLAESRGSLQVVFGVLKKCVDLWRRLFSKDG